MTKKEKRMIHLAKREIKLFYRRWRKNPYLWESETDIHAELYCKIKSSIHKEFICERDRCSWKENGITKTMPTEERFDWVYCKPKTYRKDKSKYYYPDIVIYKHIEKKHVLKEKENVPMLWACEIKYATEWSSDISDSDSSIKNDGDKLMELLKQKDSETGGADYACLLVFSRWMKQYKSQRKNAIEDLKNRYIKIKKDLANFKNKGIDVQFYKKSYFKYEK